MPKQVSAALAALLIALSALTVIGANPAGAHRGPAHNHESSASQSSGAAEPSRNQPTSSRAPSGASSSGGQPTAAVSKGTNDMTMGAAAAVGFVSKAAAGAVLVVGFVKAANDNNYQGYTGPREQSGRNQPSSSRVPASARNGR